jgi:steroid delta-isomerase-like uncharacterized protein
MDIESNKSLVREFIEQVINKKNVDIAGNFMSNDVVELVPFPNQGPGLSGVQDVLRGLFSAFPDMRWVVEEQIAENSDVGGKVLTRFSWTATHQGEFMGMPASQQPVSIWGMVIDRIVDGRIRDTRLLMDVASLVQQIQK